MKVSESKSGCSEVSGQLGAISPSPRKRPQNNPQMAVSVASDRPFVLATMATMDPPAWFGKHPNCDINLKDSFVVTTLAYTSDVGFLNEYKKEKITTCSIRQHVRDRSHPLSSSEEANRADWLEQR